MAQKPQNNILKRECYSHCQHEVMYLKKWMTKGAEIRQEVSGKVQIRQKGLEDDLEVGIHMETFQGENQQEL